MWAALAPPLVPGWMVVMLAGFTLAMFAPTWFLIIMIGRRKRWARTALVVIFFLTLVAVTLDIVHSGSGDGLLYRLRTIRLVFNASGIFWLFQSDASEWFSGSGKPEVDGVSGNRAEERV